MQLGRFGLHVQCNSVLTNCSFPHHRPITPIPQASNILVESPSAQGCLYFLAAFLSVQYFWVQKMHYDARFVVTDDLYHRGFELLGLVILASVVLHIRPVSVLGDWTHSSAMFALALSLTFSWLYHIWRCLELFVAGQGQQSVIRAMAWREIGLASISLVFCIAATVVTGMDYYENQSVEIAETGNRILVSTADKQVDEHNNTSTYDKGLQSTSESSSSDLAIWLILSATVVHYSIFFVQVVFLFPNDGSHKNYGMFGNRDSLFCCYQFSPFLFQQPIFF